MRRFQAIPAPLNVQPLTPSETVHTQQQRESGNDSGWQTMLASFGFEPNPPSARQQQQDEAFRLEHLIAAVMYQMSEFRQDTHKKWLEVTKTLAAYQAKTDQHISQFERHQLSLLAFPRGSCDHGNRDGEKLQENPLVPMLSVQEQAENSTDNVAELAFASVGFQRVHEQLDRIEGFLFSPLPVSTPKLECLRSQLRDEVSALEQNLKKEFHEQFRQNGDQLVSRLLDGSSQPARTASQGLVAKRPPAVMKEAVSSLSKAMDTQWTEREHKLAHDPEFHNTAPSIKEAVPCESIASIFRPAEWKRKYRAAEFYKTSGWEQQVVRSSRFDALGGFMTTANVLYLGIEADQVAENLYDRPWPYIACTQIFALFFVFEIWIRFRAFANTRDCFRDGWFRFDLFLAIMVVVDDWILMVIDKFIFHWDTNPTARFPGQIGRMFKLIKLCRIGHFMKTFPELMTMIRAIKKSVRVLASALMMILFLLYLFGVLIHMMMKEEESFNNDLFSNYTFQFNTLSNCLWTLFVDGVMQLDNTGLIMSDLVNGGKFNHVAAGCVFIVFSLLANYLILQMLIAMLCDVMFNVKDDQRQEELMDATIYQLELEFKAVSGNSGRITREQLKSIMTTPESKALLKALKINRAFFIEIATLLYPTPEATVSVNIIAELLVQCRGDNNTTVDIMSSGISFLNKELATIERHILARLADVQLQTYSWDERMA